MGKGFGSGKKSKKKIEFEIRIIRGPLTSLLPTYTLQVIEWLGGVGVGKGCLISNLLFLNC